MIKPLQYQSTVASGTVARVEPNIKWFGKYPPVMLSGKDSDVETSTRRFWFMSLPLLRKGTEEFPRGHRAFGRELVHS